MSGAAAFEPDSIDSHAYKVLVKEVKDIAIFFLNPKGEIVSWNDGAAHMKGYTEKEIIGKYYGILFTDEERQKDQPEEELRQAREKGRYTSEGFRRRKNGTHFRAHVTLTRQMDDKGKVLGFFKITRDVTERYFREKEAALKTEEIERPSRLKDEFIGIASHEMKNPLTTVKAYMQLLKDKFALAKDIQKYVSRSYDQVSRLEKLIGDMLNTSSIDSGNLKLNISRFDLQSMVKETIENLKHIHCKHKIGLASDDRVMIDGDRDRLEQVIVNYVTNAMRYSPEGSEITVTVKRVNDEAEVCVKDHGRGISKTDQAKVFGRFFRSEESGKKAGGLGLGLYIVKGIINQHKGEVAVESELGKGSRFYFRIPMAQAPAEGERSKTA
jgi:PAS domain S-box-containing protein